MFQPFNMEIDNSEPMEYEYTNAQPQPNADLFGQRGTTYKPPTPGTFFIPESLFDNKYSQSSIVSDTICEGINNFSLNEPIPESKAPIEKIEERKAQDLKRKKSEKKAQSLVLFSPKLSSQNVPELITNKSPTISPVDQDTIPLGAPITSTFTPSPTYYNNNYHYFPPPPDPVVQSHTRIYFIGQLIKIILTTIAIIAVMYACVHSYNLIKVDMHEKIQERETVIVHEKFNCQKAYDINRCSSDVIVPAVAPMCRKWEICIYEPIVINRAKLLGESIGSMLNGFFEQLTLQSKFVLIMLSLTTIWALKGIIVAQLT